jgi:signal transduction histidine kinase
VQAAQQANRAKDVFLSTLSHALRSPLQTITGWTHFLKQPNAEQEMRMRAVQAIERSAHAQAQLLDYVTDMARLEAGRLQLHHQSVDMAQVIAAAAAQVQEYAQHQQAHLQPPQDIPALTVQGDAHRLQQAVCIMLHAAVQYAGKDDSVSWTLRQDGMWVELAATTAGRGLNALLLPHLFDVYAQPSDQPAARPDCGSLQRTLARKLAQLHGGSIVAQQAGPGQDVIFLLRLPLAAVAVARQ